MPGMLDDAKLPPWIRCGVLLSPCHSPFLAQRNQNKYSANEAAEVCGLSLLRSVSRRAGTASSTALPFAVRVQLPLESAHGLVPLRPLGTQPRVGARRRPGVLPLQLAVAVEAALAQLPRGDGGGDGTAWFGVVAAV